MDDQFGGRTDDDLFADEFEPVQVVQPESTAVPTPEPTPAPTQTVKEAPATTSTAPVTTSKDAPSAQTPTPATTSATTVPFSVGALPQIRGSLAQSRHNRPPSAPSTPSAPRASRSHAPNHQHSAPAPAPAPAPAAAPAPASTTEQQTTAEPPTGPSAANTPTAPKDTTTITATKPDPKTRLGSGANPRTKLTEAQLADKMEKMRILNAEKTESFNRAEQDQQRHAIALEKSKEEAKKRKAEEAERKRRADASRQQMEDERAKNRERKLRAIGSKDGGWDEGKDEREEEEERRRGGQNFRGANGGIRGSSRGGGGLAGSMFASAPADEGEYFGESRRGGRGRGRGGRGRSGRGGYGSDGGHSHNGSKAAVLAPEDFPALPPSKVKESAPPSASKPEESATPPAPAPAPASAKEPLPDLASPMSPVRDWGDEMEAFDAQMAKTKATDDW